VRNYLYICAVLLLIGTANLPIGYYTFLRIAVTAGAVWVLIDEFRLDKKTGSFWIFVLIAILFNPIIPVYLHSKVLWTIIDVVAAFIFWGRGVAENRNKN
jgi:hypothetical protein